MLQYPNAQPFTDLTLPDGNRLIHVRSTAPVSYISVWLNTGARHDPEGGEGLAHLMEHLFMKTSSRFPSDAETMRHYGARGIAYNASTSPHRMFFRYRTAADRTVPALRDFLEIFGTAYIDPEMFRTEKAVIRDERAKRMSLPSRQANELLKQALYPGAPFARNVLGSDASVAALTLETAETYVNERIRQAHKTFVIVGPTPTDKIAAALDGFHMPAAAPTRPDISSALLPPLPRLDAASTGRNAEVRLGFRTCPANAQGDVLALGLLAGSYLTGRSGSRLGLRLRVENNLTYGIHALLEHAHDAGYVSLQFTTTPRDVTRALDLCEEEIERIKTGDMPEEDLHAAKEDRALALLEETLDPASHAAWYAIQALAGAPLIAPEQAEKAIRSVTAAELADVARRYFTDANRSVAVLGGV